MDVRAKTLIALLLGLTGCVHLQPKEKRYRGVGVAATQAQCTTYDNHIVSYTLTAVVAGAVGGGVGALSPTIDNKIAQYSLGGGVVLLTGLGAAMTYLATVTSKRYADECTVNQGGK